MFRLGISEGFDEIDANPASGTEPVYMKAPRDKRPTTDELSRLWALWDGWIEDGRCLLGWQFQLRVLTAQRGAEVLNMRWSTLDGDRWTKPFEIRKRRKHTAKPTDYLIVLGPMALSILAKIRAHHEAELARMNDAYNNSIPSIKIVRGRSGWPRTLSDRVFPGRRDSSKGATNFWGEEVAEMIRDAKLTDFRPHDLRRWASTSAQSVCPPDWVERYLDHEIPGVGGVYNLYAYEAEKRYVACAIENKVRETLKMAPIEMPPVEMPGVRYPSKI
jgi:integrase